VGSDTERELHTAHDAYAQTIQAFRELKDDDAGAGFVHLFDELEAAMEDLRRQRDAYALRLATGGTPADSAVPR
jgi:hypothetical protein